jgi:HlyD family secretion protein
MPAPSAKGSRAIRGGLLFIAAAIGGFALGGTCVYFYLRYYDNGTPPTEVETPLTIDRPDRIVALGRIQPQDGIISLGVPTPDRIRRILVKEGDVVKKGDLLAILDSEQMRKRELESAVIQYRQAKKRLEAITANGAAQIRAEQLRREQTEKLEPLELKALESKIAFLKAQKENAEKDRDRFVAVGDTIAAHDREKQDLALRQAQMELIATQNQLEKLRTSSQLNRRVAEARLQAMQAELKQGQSAISLDLLLTQIKQAEEQLKETQVYAPSEGKILRILIHEGELVQGKPIMQMANLDKMIVVAEVPISFVPRVHVKDRASITSRVFEELGHKELGGEVYSIGEIVGKPQVANLDPLASVDYRIVEVKVLLDQKGPAAQYIGHEVTVTIQPQKR